MSTEGGKKAVIAAMLANLGIAVTKFIAFLLTGFSSMLAESIHSVADTSNQVLLLVGGKRADRDATPQHPFGFGRERYVYSFVVAIILFSLGGLFALYEAWHKYQEVSGESDYDPFESRWWWVPVVVLVIAIGMEGMSFRTAVRESNKTRGKRSWLRFVKSSKSPELPVILLEDFGALIGLSFALLGVGLMLLTGNPIFDVLGSAMIGVLLVVIAAFLARGDEVASSSARPPPSSTRRRSPRRSRPPTPSTGSSTCAPCTSARRSCSSPPSWPSAAPTTPTSWPGRSTTPSARPGRRCRTRPRHLHRARQRRRAEDSAVDATRGARRGLRYTCQRETSNPHGEHVPSRVTARRERGLPSVPVDRRHQVPRRTPDEDGRAGARPVPEAVPRRLMALT